MSEWRDISTAPKDSGAILVWCPENENVHLVIWPRNYEPPTDYDAYLQKQTGWRFFGGDRWLLETPTHWMPLPEPPK